MAARKNSKAKKAAGSKRIVDKPVVADVPPDRFGQMSDAEKVIANDVDHGFKKIFNPSDSQNGLVQGKKKPEVPNNPEAREKYADLLLHKLLLFRNCVIPEINDDFNNTEPGKKTSKSMRKNPIAQAFADPTKPLPISLRMQDTLRLLLCYAIIMTCEEQKGLKNTEDYKTNVRNRDLCWRNLKGEVANALPGDQRAREKQAQRIMKYILEESLEACKLDDKMDLDEKSETEKVVKQETKTTAGLVNGHFTG